MTTKNKIISFLGIFLPTLAVFKFLFLPGVAVWGDAPYFYSQVIAQLFSEPQAWTERGIILGGVNNLLWISPLMILYGLLGAFLHLNNDIVIRILFYIPAILLSAIGAYIFTKSLKVKPIVCFFTVFIYTLNTYFLLLIDGGQVGVALAYGLFPVILYFLYIFIKKPSINTFYLSLGAVFFLSVADSRVSIISLFTIFVWYLFEVFLKIRTFHLKTFIFLALIATLQVPLNAYWLYPTLMNGSKGSESLVSDLQLTSLLNAFLLYQPHWPNNIFGKITHPPFYFSLLPIFLFGSLIFKKSKQSLQLVFLFLVFSFLIKGTTAPGGNLYEWILHNVPFAVAFRDSTKFFIPLMLVSGILIGMTIQEIQGKIQNQLIKKSWIVVAWAFLLFLIHPVLLGNLKGVLSPKEVPGDYHSIATTISQDNSLSRSAWFPARSPYAFDSFDHPAFDARDLVNLRPFASLNVGTDPFNFLNSSLSIDWLKLFGVKYLVLPGSGVGLSSLEEEQDWQAILSTVHSFNLKKIDSSSIPFYEIPDVQPKAFITDKLLAVIGADDFYQKEKSQNASFSLPNQGIVYLEDGKTNPEYLLNVASTSAVVVLNETEEQDILPTFLQKYMTDIKSATTSNWALREPSDYLHWKYELLQKGSDIKSFDYNRGIAFSSEKGEKLELRMVAPIDGTYVLAIRSLSSQGGLKATFNNNVWDIASNNNTTLSWNIKNDISLKKGTYSLTLENTGGLQVFNVAFLVPKLIFDKAQDTAKQITENHKVVTIKNGVWSPDVQKNLESHWQPAHFEESQPLQYKVVDVKPFAWLIWNESFDPNWIYATGFDTFHSLPMYSTINGFYTERADTGKIVYKGQENFRWGVYYSVLTLLGLSVVYFWLTSKND